MGISEEEEQVIFEPKETKNSLDVLYLPPSIPNLKYMSPALWNWITNGDNYIQVFSPAGDLLVEPLPRVLTSPPPLPTTERPIQPRKISPISSKMAPIANKQARKPIHADVEPEQNKYFFLNLKNFQLNKAQSEQIICVIGVEDQKRCSSIVDLQKVYASSKNSTFLGEMNEGFLL
jgi:hypothetical protein